jgi:SAM-dependent methyltransferase
MADATLPRRPVYAGLFMVTLATLMYEILLTRIFSVTMWYHFAFVAISVAMFGMTLGAIVVYLRPTAYPAERAPRLLAIHSLAYAVSIIACFLVYLRIPFIGNGSLRSLACLTASYVVIAVPFTFSGIVVALALTRFPSRIDRLYAADLLGAAIGCPLLIVALQLTGAATSVLIVGALAAVGAACFALGQEGATLRRVGLGAAAALALAAAGHGVLERQNRPLIDIVDTGKMSTSDYRYVRWNSHSRVSVKGRPNRPTRAVGWGLSRKTGASEARARQLLMAVDTWAATVITHYDGDPKSVAYLEDDVTNLAHHLRHDADVFVVGVGGGRDVLSALVFGQRSVTGVEINQFVLDATTRVFGDFSGHLERDPRVTLAVDEARSYITRSPRRFDIVQISLIDTWAATAAGAFVLTENSLYTVEAWRTFLQHLKPHGILSVSRWYYPRRPGEALRIVALARGALDSLGVPDPRAHVVLVEAPHVAGLAGGLGNGVATILVSPDPFSPSDLEALGRVVRRLGFDPVVTPGRAERPEYDEILSSPDPRPFYASYPLDVSPPTDDRPFFFQMLRVGDFTASLAESAFDPNRANLEAIRLLGVLLLIVTVLTSLCILVPLWLRTAPGTLAGSGSLLGYFLAIGLGFMFVEISQMQRLMVMLGHPTYALSVVLFTLLVGTGIGSFASGRVGVGGALRPLPALAALVAVLAAFGLLTPLLVRALAGATTPLRILGAASTLGVIGLFLGLPFPLGMRVGAARAEPLLPWLWGINGAASVLCSVLATVFSLGLGISATFWAGVACYAVALGAFAHATRGAIPPAHSPGAGPLAAG